MDTLETEKSRMIELSGIKPTKVLLISYDRNNPNNSEENLDVILDFIASVNGNELMRPVTTTIIFNTDMKMELIRNEAKKRILNVFYIILEIRVDESKAEMFSKYNVELNNNFQELLKNRI